MRSQDGLHWTDLKGPPILFQEKEVVPVSDLVRFSVSLESDLLEQFDRYCNEGRFATRSEAIRQLLRDTLTTHAWESDAQDAAATLTLVYDHHRTHLAEKLMDLQHRNT